MGKKGDKKSAYEVIQESGYLLAAGLDDFKSKKDKAEKILLLQNEGVESHELKRGEANV